MYVLCINTLGTIPFDGKNIESPLRLMMTYTVVGFDKCAEKTFYILDEIGPGVSFIDAAFLPLSDLDETLLINHPIKKSK